MHSSVSGDLDELANEVSQLRSKDVVQEKKTVYCGDKALVSATILHWGDSRTQVPLLRKKRDPQMYLHLEQSGFNLSMGTGICLEGEDQEFKLSSDFFLFFFSDQKNKKKNPMYLALDSADMSLDSEQAMFQTY